MLCIFGVHKGDTSVCPRYCLSGVVGVGQDLRISKAIPFPAWKKGSHFAGSCRLKQFRHVVFLVLRVFELRKFTYIYVYVYMYVEKVWHMYIYN